MQSAMADDQPRPASPIATDPQKENVDAIKSISESQGPKILKKKIIRRKIRPARPQVDPATLAKSALPPQTGTIFNLWYGKWSGGQRDESHASQTHASSRCSISRDSGYTRADHVQGSFFCLFFARGICPKGQDCEYLHRLPAEGDISIPNIDCFGRDKHSEYRDDMGGVGSFLRQNRTLYVGRVFVDDKIEEMVSKHFLEWGKIERIRVLNARGVAFVTYVSEAQAQFAKEAMAHQSLDNDEILNVRWATADPNPVAQAREKRKVDRQAEQAIRRALPADFLAELDSNDSEATKRRRHEEQYVLEGYDAPDAIRFGERHDTTSSSVAHPVAMASSTSNDTAIITASTFAALQDRHHAVADVESEDPKKAKTAVGRLVGYESDSD